MSDKAVIRGSYADLKFIKTRSVAQIVIEVPIEQGEQIVRVFGAPQPGHEVPVAVARIQDQTPVTPQKPKGGELARRAGILCGDERFQKWITDEHDNQSAENAAMWLRAMCHIDSRAELDHNPEAAEKFKALEAEFRQAYGMMAERYP